MLRQFARRLYSETLARVSPHRGLLVLCHGVPNTRSGHLAGRPIKTPAQKSTVAEARFKGSLALKMKTCIGHREQVERVIQADYIALGLHYGWGILDMDTHLPLPGMEGYSHQHYTMI